MSTTNATTIAASASAASVAPPEHESLLATVRRLVPRRHDWILYGTAIACLALGNLLAYLAPLVGSATLDLVIAENQTANVAGISRRIVAWLGGAAHLRAHLWLAAAVMAALTAVSGVFLFLKGRLAALAADGFARDLKNRLYDHLQRLPTRFHDRADSGDLVQRCTSDVETMRTCLSTQVVEIGNALLLVLTALPLMLLLSPPMTALSFALIGPIVLFGFVYIRRVKHVFRQVDEAEGRVTSRVQENLTGIRVVRAFARQEFEKERFAKPNAEYRDRSLQLMRLMAWYWSCSDFVCLLQNGIVLIGGAWLVAEGRLTVGALFAFLTFLNLLLWPVRQMGRILTDLGKTSVALRRLREILDVAEEEPMPAPTMAQTRAHAPARAVSATARETSPSKPQPTLPLAPIRGRVEFRDVGFAHEQAPDGRKATAASDNALPAAPANTASTPAAPARHALDGVSFTVAAGETLAILGPSGSGKSTIIHLLLRLYDCQRGEILLDGHDLRTLPRRGLRGQFGVVMQEPFLYSKTLRENIRFGRSSASEAEIADAAQLAAIHETIVGFEGGYDTLIGERGITLSGGQRQRVAIARAVLRDPPVLVLDDALSAVDAETEIAIIDALRTRRGRRTTILIAHRLATLAHADRVIVLEHGRVVQQGTHAELAATPGLYQRLWRIQTRLNAESDDLTAAAGGSLPATDTSGPRP